MICLLLAMALECGCPQLSHQLIGETSVSRVSGTQDVERQPGIVVGVWNQVLSHTSVQIVSSAPENLDPGTSHVCAGVRAILDPYLTSISREGFSAL